MANSTYKFPCRPYIVRLSRPVKFNGKACKLMKFGEGIQPGIVEWELNQRKLRKGQREDEKQWARLQATRTEREDDTADQETLSLV